MDKAYARSQTETAPGPSNPWDTPSAPDAPWLRDAAVGTVAGPQPPAGLAGAETGTPLFLESIETTGLLKSIIEWTVELLGVDAGEIYLYDAREQNIRLSVVCGSMERFHGATLRPGEGLAGKVFSTGQSIRVDDYQRWEGRAPKFPKIPPYQSELAVPLQWHERCIGVLVIVSNTRERPLVEADARATTLCANLVAAAIENAILYQELQNSLIKLKHTLEQEITERTNEITRQATQVGRGGAGSGDSSAGLNTDELLTRVVELRIAKKVLAEIAQVPLGGPSLQDLTPRELQILKLIGRGYNNKEIAYELKLAVSTVKFHVGSILNKLNLPDRTQAALWAVRMGLVEANTAPTSTPRD